jgi:Protein of unknown function (DUF2815)
MVERIRVNFPNGRIVQGDLYVANDTDFRTKQKKVFPAGHAKAGQPKITYFFAVAIPKVPGHTHWAQTDWGGPIWQFGHTAWPKLIDTRTGQITRDDFAWKIEDGDSQKPNKNNRVNANTEGFPGCWVVACSSAFAPKILDTNFGPITEPGAVKRGFWVEAVATVDTNESEGNPGVYINGEFVMFRAIDKEISGMIDPRTIAGFGRAALPNGVQAVGVAALAQPSAALPTPGAAPAGFPGAYGAAPPPAPVSPGFAPPPGPPVIPGAPAPAMGNAIYPSSPPPPGPPAAPAYVTPTYAAPTYVTPAPSFLNQGAAPPPPPPAPPAPPAAVGPVMLPKAGNIPYATFVANKWTDAQLRAEGYIQ